MPLFNPTLNRRTFLGGASASVALAVAQNTSGALLPRAPLAIHAVLQGANALAGLQAALANPDLEFHSVLLVVPQTATGHSAVAGDAGPKLVADVHRLLDGGNSKAAVFEVQRGVEAAHSFGPEQGLPILLLGSFSSYIAAARDAKDDDPCPLLTLLLRASPLVYVDEPVHAVKIDSLLTTNATSSRIVAGFCSSLDPAVDFAVTHLRSGAIGSVKQISACLRARDGANELEAKAIHGRLTADASLASIPPLRLMRVASVQPAITLCGARGILQVALYTHRDRMNMLPLRLRHFVAIARGDAL